MNSIQNTWSIDDCMHFVQSFIPTPHIQQISKVKSENHFCTDIYWYSANGDMWTKMEIRWTPSNWLESLEGRGTELWNVVPCWQVKEKRKSTPWPKSCVQELCTAYQNDQRVLPISGKILTLYYLFLPDKGNCSVRYWKAVELHCIPWWCLSPRQKTGNWQSRN